MEFIENKGQWNKQVHYRSDFSSGSFFLENNGFTVLLNSPWDLQKMGEYMHGVKDKTIANENFVLHSFAYKVNFLGGSLSPKSLPDKPSISYNNYFLGNDEKLWASNCKQYQAVTYKNVYPNIDIRYYSNGDKLKYDFIVHPGGNPNNIAMRFDGGAKLSIKNKELIIATPIGDIKELPPYTYQTNEDGKLDIATKFVINDNVVSFKIEKYNPNATLIIDPQIIFCSFTGSAADNWGYTATPGPDGTFFAGGIAFGSGYPTSAGAFQTNYGGGGADCAIPNGYDIAIFKFSPDGGSRLYATYLGGNGNEQPHSMIVDAAGNLVVAGRTNSSNFPLKTNIPATGSNYDIIITKFNAAGTAIIGSVKIGGSGDDGVNIRPKYCGTQGTDRLRRNYGDDARSEVILDANNNVILASCTQSSNFPTQTTIQSSPGGNQDGVILKLTPTLSNIIFSTYFGGSDDDACFVTSINPTNGNIYVAGVTKSNNLLGNTFGTIGANNKGDIDGFVTILNPSGTAILRTTYLGTNAVDMVYGLKFDKLGYPYVMGTTTGNWPVINAVYNNPDSKQFISKLQPDLTAYVYSTIFGTSSPDPNISPIAFLVDRCENVYVSGWGGGINVQQNYSTSNTNNLQEVNPLSPIQAPDGADFYFFVLRKDAVSQLFGSHFGQFGGFSDHVDGGTSRFDANGIIYQAICANCSGRSQPNVVFPTTPGVWARFNGGNGCNEAALKIEMNFAGVGAEIQSEIDGEINDSLGCIPLRVDFKDIKAKGITYYWNFGDPASGALNTDVTTTPSSFHVFNNVGTFRVTLIAEDLSTCNQRDTSFINIKTGRDKVFPDFVASKLGACTSKQYQFVNTTSSLAGLVFLPKTFVWDYGDGSPVDTANFNSIITHNYASSGTYPVQLTIIDDRFCNSPKDTIKPLRISDNVVAKDSSSSLGCAPYIPIIKNKSDAGLSWLWELFDATTNVLIASSIDFNPTFPALPVGTYKYRLTAFDSTTCNKIDVSAFKTITVVQKPVASADWAPNPPQANVPVRFSNLSSFADTYLWEFGDGETSTAFAPINEYNATKTYNAKLTAYSRAGCSDTFLFAVNVIVNPLLDVPNAFTPGRFGINSIVNVRGFGIEEMDWRIYNRWGQMVFQSSNKRVGWDGTFKGKLLPIDVYSYTLNVTFSDGNKLTKTGDITLLR